MSEFKHTEWDLDAIAPAYASDAYKQVIADITTRIETFVSCREQLSESISIDAFVVLVKEYYAIKVTLQQIGARLYLQQSKDTSDETTKAAVATFTQWSAQISNKMRFFHLWFVSLSQEKAYTLAQSLGEDVYQWKRRHDLGKYNLSEKEENVMSLKDTTGSDAFISLYDSIVGSISFDLDGETLNLGQMSSRRMSPDRAIRKDAYERIKVEFNEKFPVLSEIYAAVSRDFDTETVELRKYDSVLAVRAISEEISEESVRAMLSAVREFAPKFQSFFKLKAKLLDLPILEQYDMFAPIGKVEKKMSFTDAMQLILNTTKEFSPEFSQIIQTLYETNHIDSVTHPNKRLGAFNYMICGKGPHVFLQYLDKEDDLYTLAHELGHAVHSHLSRDKSVVSHHASLGVCESVSTLFEELVFTHQLQTLTREEKIASLASRIQDIYSTIITQTYYTIFEEEAHKAISEGKTASDLSAIWHSLQVERFGDSVILPDKINGWVGIPHFYHVPFYCFNYAIGNILSLLVLHKYKKDPESVRGKIHAYLCAGGTMDTVATAKLLDIDLENPQTWKDGLSMLDEYVSQLRSLVK
ncbi:MAG: oligoendopeptidase F [Candidatus Woesearchaeota archaeon]|jgi:oligoendopeptidase F